MSRELGYVDVVAASYNMDTTGHVVLLNTIAQGAGVTQRVGKKVSLKGLQCRGQMKALTACDTVKVAYMIVYDKRPTGALPAVTDILVSASSLALNNDANSGRFRILKRCDAIITGNETASANVTDTTAIDDTWYLDLKGLPTVYKAAATGAIGDIEEGALYLVTVGSEAGTAAGSLNAGYRTRFVDV